MAPAGAALTPAPRPLAFLPLTLKAIRENVPTLPLYLPFLGLAAAAVA